ncbi:UNVERIFIED_CONTAM: hypothetical protein FKN15_020470 [Acipenser sinensis]
MVHLNKSLQLSALEVGVREEERECEREEKWHLLSPPTRERHGHLLGLDSGPQDSPVAGNGGEQIPGDLRVEILDLEWEELAVQIEAEQLLFQEQEPRSCPEPLPRQFTGGTMT